ELVLRPSRSLAAVGDSADTAALLRTALGGSARVERAGTELDRARADAAPLAWFGLWFGVAGAAALLVALFGTYDTVGVWVRSVSGELAMRRAAGATRARIARFVAGRAVIAVLSGSVAGMLIFTTLVREYLALSVPGLPARDVTVIVLCTAALLAAALAGAAAATRRFLGTAP